MSLFNGTFLLMVVVGLRPERAAPNLCDPSPNSFLHVGGIVLRDGFKMVVVSMGWRDLVEEHLGRVGSSTVKREPSTELRGHKKVHLTLITSLLSGMLNEIAHVRSHSAEDMVNNIDVHHPVYHELTLLFECFPTSNKTWRSKQRHIRNFNYMYFKERISHELSQ